jgi:hypothetical protein
LRFDDDLSSTSSLLDLKLSDVKDDVFMGYYEDQAMPMHFKVEIDDNEDGDEIDQVVPIQLNEEIRCEDSTLDVIVLCVN